MTRAELIARMEAAEGPSRELDCAIAEFLRPEFRKKPWRRDKWHDRHYDDSDPHGMHYEIVPHYTASIDVALTLVQDGHSWVMGCLPDAMVWRTGNLGAPFRAGGATPAIALCIAALKAGEKE